MHHYIGQVLYYNATVCNTNDVFEFFKIVSINETGIFYDWYDKDKKEWKSSKVFHLPYDCVGYKYGIRREITELEKVLYL